MINECDGVFKHHLDRYKYANRYDGADSHLHRAEGMKFIEQLDLRLDGSAYLCGPVRGLTDIAIFPFVRQFCIADLTWFDAQPVVRLHEWLNTLTTSPLFLSIMKKYPAWKETGKEFAFPTL